MLSTGIKSLVNSVRQAVSDKDSTILDLKTGTPISELFTKVDKVTDGEECDQDCDSCVVKYPRAFKINESDELYGSAKEWSTHMLIATGMTNWVKDIADEEGSVMEAIAKFADVKPNNGRMIVSASNIPTPSIPASYADPTTVLLLPAWLIIDNVTPKSVNILISEFVNKGPTNTTLVDVKMPHHSSQSSLHTDGLLSSKPCPHNAIILLCSHGTRDARCSQSAPLLRKEFERHLREYGIYRSLDDERSGGVGIYFVSHVGGHKYAANVWIYRKENAFGLDKLGGAHVTRDLLLQSRSEENPHIEGAAQCIRLARVRPEDCMGIIKYTVLQGKVVKPEKQLTGGFDRQRGLFSW